MPSLVKYTKIFFKKAGLTVILLKLFQKVEEGILLNSFYNDNITQISKQIEEHIESFILHDQVEFGKWKNGTMKTTRLYWEKSKIQTNGKMSCSCGSDELMSLKCLYYPKTSSNSTQSTSKLHSHSSQK